MRYCYDALGRESVVVSPFKDCAPTSSVSQCRATYFYYASNAILSGLNFPVADDTAYFNDRRPRLVVEMLQGKEISRVYHHYADGSNVHVRVRIAGAGYDAPGHQVSVERAVSSGDHRGRPASMSHPNGTYSLYAYAYDAPSRQLTRTTTSGAGSLSAITNGIRTIAVQDAMGRALSRRTEDVASGLTLSHSTTTRDIFGRVLMSSNVLAGTASTFVYGCCGIEQSVNEDGIESSRTYTPIKQIESSTVLGVTTWFSYDAFGNTVETRRSVPGQPDSVSRVRFDALGRTESITNALGIGTHFNVSTNESGGRRESVQLPNGSVRFTDYYRDGQRKCVYGSAAVPLYWDYGVHADGSTWTVQYAGTNTLASQWVKTCVDVLGNVTNVSTPDGYAVTTHYDSLGREVRRGEAFGMQFTTYDDRSQPVVITRDMNANAAVDLSGNDRVLRTDTKSASFNGHPVLETQAWVLPDVGSNAARLMSTTRSAVTGDESWQTAFGRTNHVSTARNRALKTRTQNATYPDGTVVRSEYTNGLLAATERLDADSTVIARKTYAYDHFNRLALSEEPDPNGGRRQTRYQYDAADQLTNVTLTAGALTQSTGFEYDAMGRQTRITRPDGGVVTRVYSPRGELIEESGAGTYPVRYTYDDQGRMQSLATFRKGFDGAADITQWRYDPQRGFMQAKIFADGSTNRFVYRADGAVIERHWARGVVTRYQYDRSGAVTNIAYSDGTAPIDYTYDRLGQALAIDDAAGTHLFSYNSDGSIASEHAAQIPATQLTRNHDALGRYVGYTLSTNATSLSHVAYGFDRAGRMQSATAPGVTVSYVYGADGQSLTATDYGVYETSRTYDGLGRLECISNGTVARTVHQSTYALNAINQRTRRTLADGRSWDYAYDALGQVVSGKAQSADGIPMGGRQFEFDYDQIGNRRSARNQRGVDTQESTYSANALNQYEQRTVPGEVFVGGTVTNALRVSVSSGQGAAATPANRNGDHFWSALSVDNQSETVILTNITVTALTQTISGNATNMLERTETRSALVPRSPEHFTHDADGNLLSDGLWHYTWNAENRLIRMTHTNVIPPPRRTTLDFAYDHLGRRFQKTVRTATATNTTIYLYDNWNIILESVTGTRQPTITTYTWGPDLSKTLTGAGGVGGLLAVTTHTNTHYPAYDGNGNLTAYVTPTGTPISTREYTPFGQTLSQTGPTFTHNFSTKPQDRETKLYAYTYRYYHPTTGRWLNRDPIGERGGANLRVFSQNGAVNKRDPFGLTNDPGDFGLGWYDPGFYPEQPGTDSQLSAPDWWTDAQGQWEAWVFQHYMRNDILAPLCPELARFAGRTDITQDEIDEFVRDVSDKDVKKVEQSKNLFHQNPEDACCTKNKPEKFRNHKWVYGSLGGQGASVDFNPCELILRENGKWGPSCNFVSNETWSFVSDHYVYGTHNFGGDNWTHTWLDVVPWVFFGSTPEETNGRDLQRRLCLFAPSLCDMLGVSP